MSEKKTIYVSFYVSPSLDKSLRLVAALKKKSRSQIIRESIDEYIGKYVQSEGGDFTIEGDKIRE